MLFMTWGVENVVGLLEGKADLVVELWELCGLLASIGCAGSEAVTIDVLEGGGLGK